MANLLVGEYCVSVKNLHKSYNNIHAVNGITFDVEYGKVFGILGPNGAGKTTTIKLLTTLLKPSSGKILIFGKDITMHPLEIKKKVGIVSQRPSYENNLTVEKSIEMYGQLWDVPTEIRKRRTKELLHVFQLEGIRKTKNDDLSIGQRRRVQVAREFVHDMDLLFLDEPTVGLDPTVRRVLLDYILEKVMNGLTVIFTTHVMEEAEYLCDKIAIINRGRIVALDTPSRLRQVYGEIKSLEIKFRKVQAESVLPLMETIPGCEKNIEVPEPHVIRINSKDAQYIMTQMIGIFSQNSIEVENITLTDPTLEEVFLKTVQSTNDTE